MKKRSIGKGLLCMILLMIGLLMTGCNHKENKQKKLLVGAAASLRTVMEKLKVNYEEEKEDISLVFTYASSGTLEQQIRQGAPMDLFLSASGKQIKSLSEDQYLIEGTVSDLAENRIVLIVPADSDLDLIGFENITRASKIAIGDPESVPAGNYACEVFEYYGILEEVKKSAVYGKDVTEVLAWVSSGSVDAGVVYATDAAVTDRVTVVAVAPEESHSKVVYPGAVVQGTKQETEAKEFLEYLSSEEAQKLYADYGFIPAD